MTTKNSEKDDKSAKADVLYRTGMGNWAACIFPVAKLIAAAETWRAELDGISLPWLCWNVDPDWCVLQQRIILNIGWTPVVGFDPRVGPPPVEIGAKLVDFNREFNLPILYPHFVIELAFVFSERLAFWHSDLLARISTLQTLADNFIELRQGELAAVPVRGLRKLLRPWSHRYWEVIGCTTRDASKDQFELGAGWWYNFIAHPNYRGKPALFGRPYGWDHGTGVMYWARQRRARVHEISESLIADGHFTSIGANNYVRTSPNNHMRNLNAELGLNFNLATSAERLGLGKFLGRLQPGQRNDPL
jgi:hypothetical protein